MVIKYHQNNLLYLKVLIQVSGIEDTNLKNFKRAYSTVIFLDIQVYPIRRLVIDT